MYSQDTFQYMLPDHVFPEEKKKSYKETKKEQENETKTPNHNKSRRYKNVENVLKYSVYQVDNTPECKQQ